MRTCSKTQKYWTAHNFFNFDRNIGMLHLVLIMLMRGIQVIYRHIMHGETCTDKVNVSEQES